MAKLAITGITGKSGLYLWDLILLNKEIIEKSWPEGINLISRDIKKLESLKKGYIKTSFFAGDLKDNDTLLKSFTEGCDTLLHIAGIHWSLELVKIAITNGVKRLILVHTTGIYSKYKAAGEEYRNIDSQVYKLAKENGVALTILRPTMIYGDISDRNVIVFIKMVDKFKIMPTVNGAHYELQPVHCGDLGDAYFKVLTHPSICDNKDYILSGGAPIELREMFNQIAKNLGVNRKYISCPFGIAYVGAWIIYILSIGRVDYREKVQRLVEPRVYSHDEAKKDFEYTPRTFQDGVIDEVRDYLNNKN